MYFSVLFRLNISVLCCNRHGEEGGGLTLSLSHFVNFQTMYISANHECVETFTFLWVSTLHSYVPFQLYVVATLLWSGKVCNVLSKISGGFILTNVEKAVPNSGLCRLAVRHLTTWNVMYCRNVDVLHTAYTNLKVPAIWRKVKCKHFPLRYYEI